MAGSTAEAIFQAIVDGLCAKEAVWLATVLQTWGSSPRPCGSMMVWSHRTGVVGSVSGGCIEDDILQKIQRGRLSTENPMQLRYGGAEADTRFRLPCGGELLVVIEPLSSNGDSIAAWQSCLDLLRSRIGVKRVANVKTGQWYWSQASPFELYVANNELHCYAGPTRKLLIVGANPTAQYLAEFATALDFAVTICDPSDDLTGEWTGSEQFQFLAAYPDGFVGRDFGDRQSAVVTVSHDPRLDDMALLEALPTEAFYIGAMGSLQTSAARRERLGSLGVSAQQLQKLHAPIGLDIGSKTPGEIAVSIIAHLVQTYHGDSRKSKR